jgi:Protein of unknown function (DUF559)
VSLKPIARQLRRNQTDEEKELWRALHGRRFAGFKFRRQHTVGGHILDFYRADAKLAVELADFSTACRKESKVTKLAKSFWPNRALRRFDSGIISGGKTTKDVCWKSGTRCNGEQVALG